MRGPTVHLVTKTYDHNLGLSACFRQHRAKSHCRFLHGYPLSFKLTFGAKELDENNWVIDFGGLKPIKQWLVDTFDHRLVVAADDPKIDLLRHMADEGLADELVIVPFVGCEGFAEYVAKHVRRFLNENGHTPRVQLVEVEVREHSGNSAIYRGC
jgi:6-pyruvoyltetrahydropterin/6-carboxytetrahydropterin synthase